MKVFVVLNAKGMTPNQVVKPPSLEQEREYQGRRLARNNHRVTHKIETPIVSNVSFTFASLVVPLDS